MIYEFECPRGHVFEERVPMGTAAWPCAECVAERNRLGLTNLAPHHWMARRILSPTPTTFKFADRKS